MELVSQGIQAAKSGFMNGESNFLSLSYCHLYIGPG